MAYYGAAAAASQPNPRVYLDITIDGQFAGRIEIELFADTCPGTAENFRALCAGDYYAGITGAPLSYKGSRFHRIIPNLLCQAGDITHGNGAGGDSIYGPAFADETFDGRAGRHGPGSVSMANAGPNTNASQFMIFTREAPEFNRKNVVVGKVTAGYPVVLRISQCAGWGSTEPTRHVVIGDCGEVQAPGFRSFGNLGPHVPRLIRVSKPATRTKTGIRMEEVVPDTVRPPKEEDIQPSPPLPITGCDYSYGYGAGALTYTSPYLLTAPSANSGPLRLMAPATDQEEQNYSLVPYQPPGLPVTATTASLRTIGAPDAPVPAAATKPSPAVQPHRHHLKPHQSYLSPADYPEHAQHIPARQAEVAQAVVLGNYTPQQRAAIWQRANGKR